MSRSELIAKIAALPALLEALVSPLSDADLHTHYLAHEWTVAQNVHHLADLHMNSFIRFKLIMTEDNPPLKGYDQDVWATTPDYDVPIAESLAILKGLHARWVALLNTFKEEDWARTGNHSENGPMTLDRMLVVYGNHGEGHLDQIQRTLAAKPK